MSVLLFTGKGGVGKTTVAAATAVSRAAAGERTIVLSTDPAHSLADAFDAPLGSEPSQITDRLWGQQLDAQARMESSWEEIRAYLREVFHWAGIDGVEAEELALLPGFDELFALADIRSYADSGEWDTVVVDCAPTAETLRLLSLPDVLSRYMDRIFPLGRRLTRAVAPVLSRLSDLPVAGEEVFTATERFYRTLEGVRDILSDGTRTQVRIVVNPERMVVAEARRLYTYLCLFGYTVDAVVINRLLPDDISDPWFSEWKGVQKTQRAEIEAQFAPVPILPLELARTEPVGLERLAELAAELYPDGRIADPQHRAQPIRFEHSKDGWVVLIDLPFADKDDIDLGRRRDELLVKVGSHRRSVLLPDSMRRREVVGAGFTDGILQVRFSE